MCIAIIGGVKGIERDYKEMAEKYGVKYKLYNKMVPDFSKKIKSIDALILFTNTVSHKMSCDSCKVCKKYNIILKRPHSSSLNMLEEAIVEIKNEMEKFSKIL